jgi:uncharacterized membrane protein YedE/YeeE
MDIAAPFAKTGLIDAATNLWLAIPIGFIFGFALFHAGFTDSRRIAWAFYFKDVGVPVVMFSAIVTGMVGLWGMSLLGLIDISLVYMLPTYLVPMAVGGVLFGIGMVIGGYCPGTAIAAVATGKLDGIVFVGGFLIGSLVFGDFFPVWGDFYNSNYLGAFRLDQAFGISLGATILLIIVIAVVGTITMIFVQDTVWGEKNTLTKSRPFKGLQGALVATAFAIGIIFAFFPTESFIDDTVEPPFYVVPRADMTEVAP